MEKAFLSSLGSRNTSGQVCCNSESMQQTYYKWVEPSHGPVPWKFVEQLFFNQVLIHYWFGSYLKKACKHLFQKTHFHTFFWEKMVRQKLVPLLLADSFLRERRISEQRTFWGVMFEWIDPENFAQDRETAASWGSRETAAESLSSIVVTFSTHLLRPISSECCFNTLINLCVPLHCKGGVFQVKVPPAGVPVLGHHQWVFQSAISAVVRWFSWEGSFFWWTTAYSFFPEVFDQKKGSEGSRWEKTIFHSQLAIAFSD